jgi:hypothetical protein
MRQCTRNNTQLTITAQNTYWFKANTEQVTVAILLNGFLGAIAAAEEEAAEAAAAGMKSKEMLR